MLEVGAWEGLIQHSGYVGLLAVSFLAATLVPISSEVAVALMPMLGYDAQLVVVFATIGNYLGSVVNYWVGAEGARLLFARYFGTKADSMAKARKEYARWGSPILLFSWVPVIGDPLTLVAGMLRVNFLVFTLWVVAGKLARYVAVVTVAS